MAAALPPREAGRSADDILIATGTRKKSSRELWVEEKEKKKEEEVNSARRGEVKKKINRARSLSLLSRSLSRSLHNSLSFLSFFFLFRSLCSRASAELYLLFSLPPERSESEPEKARKALSSSSKQKRAVKVVDQSIENKKEMAPKKKAEAPAEKPIIGRFKSNLKVRQG